MALFRKTLSEQEAALQFVANKVSEASSSWPEIYEDLKETFGTEFLIEHEKMASFDLALAAIGLDLQAVRNLFPKPQSERIEKWVYECMAEVASGEYAREETKEYSKAFQEHTPNMYVGANPLSAVSARLLHRWLGANMQNFEIGFGSSDNEEEATTVSISPELQLTMDLILSGFIGTWKGIKSDFRLVEGDLPFKENIQAFCLRDGLTDYAPETQSKDSVPKAPDETKPDGTIEWYDESGYLRQTRIPPEELDELFRKDLARREYKILFKGPWDGIKEANWPLPESVAAGFADQEGTVCGMCVYKKGKPTYLYVARQLWDKDELGEMSKQTTRQSAEVMMDPQLLFREKQERIAELFKELSRKAHDKVAELSRTARDKAKNSPGR